MIRRPSLPRSLPFVAVYILLALAASGLTFAQSNQLTIELEPQHARDEYLKENFRTFELAEIMDGGVAFTDFSRTTKGFEFTFNSDLDAYYKVQYVNSLLNPAWIVTNMMFAETASMTSWMASSTTNIPEFQSFRIKQVPLLDPEDEDGDGMDDTWELTHGLNGLNPSDAGEDPDTDGLTNFQEHQNDSLPKTADSNGNNLLDGWDVYHGTIILGDVNGDGLLDAKDMAVISTLLQKSSFNITPVQFQSADLNLDGVVDQRDKQGLQDLLDGKPLLFILRPEVSG